MQHVKDARLAGVSVRATRVHVHAAAALARRRTGSLYRRARPTTGARAAKNTRSIATPSVHVGEHVVCLHRWERWRSPRRVGSLSGSPPFSSGFSSSFFFF
jgi:hypothetical protein